MTHEPGSGFSGGPRRVLGPAVAGGWYPAEPAVLAREVDQMLEAATPPRLPRGAGVAALVEPHAGYTYSGRVAAHGFRAVQDGSYRRVLLLGPSHYGGFRGAAVPESAEAYRTPLGEVPLDTEAIAHLAAEAGFVASDEPFRPEHSLEMEIPFLQRTLREGWKLVPLLMGPGTSGERAARVAEALQPLGGSDTLSVVSSDFTHYGPRFGYVPFRDQVPQRLRELDLGAVQRIRSRVPESFERYVAETGATICGRDAIDVLLRILGPGPEPVLAAYDTSGHLTGDWHHTVSYVSLVFPKGEKAEASP